VTDFGIARSLDVPVGLTQTGTVLGTSEYISPEQATGRQVDARTDIYSLGAVLYELLAGQPPYTGDSFVAVAMRHVNDPVPSVTAARPDVPLRVDAALRRAMAKDPDDRFQTMDELVAELSACLEGLGDLDDDRTVIVAPPVEPRARPRRRRRRWSPLVVLRVAGAAVAVAVGAYYGVRRTDSDDGGGNGSGGPPVHLVASNAYDPQGDGQEHDEEVANATDGNIATFWETEDYRGSVTFGNLKDGVGIVFDAGPASTSGFTTVSQSQTVGRRTSFRLSVDPARRYYLLWITRLAPGYPRTHVNEVTAG
jgi:serine/threonine-protein kinase